MLSRFNTAKGKGHMRATDIIEEISDRRRHERVARNYKLRYGMLEDPACDTPDKEGMLLDLGGGGLRFLADNALQKNMQLLIELDIPGWTVNNGEWTATRSASDVSTLKVLGVVMWDALSADCPGKHEVGVRFSGKIS